MRSKLTTAAIVGALLAGPAEAGSKILVTAPLRVFLGSNVQCTALNAGKKAAAVHVEIVAVIDGTTVYDFADATLAPGEVVAADVDGFPASFPTFCRVTGLSAATGRVSYVDYTSSLVVTAP